MSCFDGVATMPIGLWAYGRLPASVAFATEGIAAQVGIASVRFLTNQCGFFLIPRRTPDNPGSHPGASSADRALADRPATNRSQICPVASGDGLVPSGSLRTHGLLQGSPTFRLLRPFLSRCVPHVGGAF